MGVNRTHYHRLGPRKFQGGPGSGALRPLLLMSRSYLTFWTNTDDLFADLPVHRVDHRPTALLSSHSLPFHSSDWPPQFWYGAPYPSPRVIARNLLLRVEGEGGSTQLASHCISRLHRQGSLFSGDGRCLMEAQVRRCSPRHIRYFSFRPSLPKELAKMRT